MIGNLKASAITLAEDSSYILPSPHSLKLNNNTEKLTIRSMIMIIISMQFNILTVENDQRVIIEPLSQRSVAEPLSQIYTNHEMIDVNKLLSSDTKLKILFDASNY